VTTACVEAELKKLGPDFRGALITCKRFERRRCPHYKPISASDCLASIIGWTIFDLFFVCVSHEFALCLGEDNKHKYGVATQDAALRASLRKVPGVPLVYINNSVVLLEPPSKATANKVYEVFL
jgi:U3 small nucleolar RNA-associated protein 23